jgi:hypothetical protein
VADTYTTVLLKNLAADLQANGLGTYDSTGYDADATGFCITLFDMPPAPAYILALSSYADVNAGDTTLTATRIQIRTRVKSDPTEMTNQKDAIRNLLHRRSHVDFGAVRIGLILQISELPMGKDANGNWEWSQNFAFTGLRWLQPIMTPPTGG